MLEVRVDVIDSIPVLRLKGRLDSFGASVFDREVSLLSRETKNLIIDVSDVSYLSSLGIRSLIKLEKSLIARSGGIILTGLTPFLVQVLEVSGLLSQLRSVDSLDNALIMAKTARVSEDIIREEIINDRKYTIRAISGEGSKLDLWGSFPSISDKTLSAEGLIAVNLQELGPGFGVGGFGQNRFQASEVLGEFIAAGSLAGVVPADGHCMSDFILTDKPSESTVYIASAVGLSGKPAFFLEEKGNTALTIAELIYDIFCIIANLKENTPPIIGVALFAETIEIVGSYFKELRDIAASHYQADNPSNARGAMIVGIGADEVALKSSDDRMVSGFLEEISRYRLGKGRFFHGHGLKFTTFQIQEVSRVMDENIRRMANLDRLEGVAHIEPETKIKNPKVWIYVPSTVRSGAEKLLKIEVKDTEDFPDEWDIITRRIFSDAGKVVLTPIHGGFTSKTFHVTTYGSDGRRMLETVLKIGSIDVTRREEEAYHEYVEKYILNNTTTIMGTASYGNWAGLRYNFVGISGPHSKLSWLTDHYHKRPAEELIPLFNTIFTNILKPWYGQPRWEEIYPYVDHNPLSLFPGILDDAQRELAISPDKETLHCPELNIELPNPFNFLKHQYPLRKGYSRLWYKSVTHGDLNMQNILLDERENIYIIDFSETRARNIVSDFARLEPILKIEMTHLKNKEDLKALLEFEMGLADASALNETPPFTYSGPDRMVEKAYRLICLLRTYANKVTIFETDIIPYLLALLEWTYPVVSYGGVSLLQKRFATYSAGIIVRKILELEKS